MLNGDGTCYVILTNNSVLHKVVTVESIEDGEQLCLKVSMDLYVAKSVILFCA